jgi:hypothetical protein
METKSPFAWIFTIQQPLTSGARSLSPFLSFSFDALCVLALLSYFFRRPQIFLVLLALAAARDLATAKSKVWS